MNRALAFVAAGLLTAGAALAETPKYQKITLSEKFYAEGAYFGDFNKDGKMDIVAGPWWFEGPDFQKKHEYREVKEFKAEGYSDNFLTYVGDFNADGWPDIMHVPFPGAEGSWYENPQGKDTAWKKHPTIKGVDGESPCWGDVNGDKLPDLVCCSGGQYGYATYDPAKPDESWKFIAVTPKGGYSKFSHGQGFGDINGDGKVDLIDNGAWWEQPKDAKPGEPWIKHAFKFSPAAAQILVFDVDGDGLNDVVTAVSCHGYGISWWKQVKDAKGEISFKENVILSPKPDVKSTDFRFSQPHAFDMADFNGDGLMDFVVGKRWWAHGPKGDAEPMAAAVVVWFELKRDKEKGASFVPHTIDDNSGVGTQVTAGDVNGDKVPDVVIANKKGIFVFVSQK